MVVAVVSLLHLWLLGRLADPPRPPAGAAPEALPATPTAVRTILTPSSRAPPAPFTLAPPSASRQAAASPAPVAASPQPAQPAAPAARAEPDLVPVAPSASAVTATALLPDSEAPAVPHAAAPAPGLPMPGVETLPSYAAALPPAFEARFRLRRGALAGRAELVFEPQGTDYHLTLQTTVLGREVGHLRSEGQHQADGLAPRRFVEGRRGRDQRAVNFQRDAAGGARISFSGPATELPLPPGVQDRLSWLLQLAAIVEADPALRQPGQEVAMWIVGPRGDADVWRFQVDGMGSLDLGDGLAQPALALRREPRRPWDTEVRVWLDPQAHHLPLRAAWRVVGDDSPGAASAGGVELWRDRLVWR